MKTEYFKNPEGECATNKSELPLTHVLKLTWEHCEILQRYNDRLREELSVLKKAHKRLDFEMVKVKKRNEDLMDDNKRLKGINMKLLKK